MVTNSSILETQEHAKYRACLVSYYYLGLQSVQTWVAQVMGSNLIPVGAEYFSRVQTKVLSWAVVVAQLVEQSLPTPQICGLNSNNGKILSTNCTLK